ncbi:MAG TPA: glycerol-3-phosphate acyltransferase [Acidimicrobiia bacterium]|nr:glycerol-3-phosphate acyltransferase [Acidimicrobiia bacterium]
MTILLAALAGYAIGSVPTAVWLGRLWRVDLLQDGSGNPGANNARRLGGHTLAILILIIEVAKGLTAVVVGLAIGGEAAIMGGEAASLAAGLGAVAGNVYNVWHQFKGGKGLGVSGGVVLGLWPAAFPFIVLTLVFACVLTRSTGIGTLVTLGAVLVGAFASESTGLENPWGLADPVLLVLLVIGIGLIIGPRHWRDARNRLRSPVRP